MNVFIKLTSASTNTGPFNLYSDADGYNVPFETNVAKNTLINGYVSILVPNTANTIRIQSEGICEGYITIPIQEPVIPTTTTTTTGQYILPTTTTTTTTVVSTTTTTSTTAIPVQPIVVAKTVSGPIGGLCGKEYDDANAISVTHLYFQSVNTVPAIGEQLYTDVACTIPFVGDDADWASVILFGADTTYNCVIGISAAGLVTSITSCSQITTTTTTLPPTTTTTTTILSYHVEMCVNATTYDEPNEVSVPYLLAPVLINTPTKVGYNYLFFSIPIARTFVIKDALGADVTTDFALDTGSGASGLDIRPGYYNNYIFRSSDVFASSISLEYTIILLQ